MTKVITFPLPLQKGASDQNPVEVGDNVTLIVKGEDGVKEDVTVELTYVGLGGREIGWNPEDSPVDPQYVEGVASAHNPTCASE